MHTIVRTVRTKERVSGMLIGGSVRDRLSGRLFAYLGGALVPIRHMPIRHVGHVAQGGRRKIMTFVSSIACRGARSLMPFLFRRKGAPLFIVLSKVASMHGFKTVTHAYRYTNTSTVVVPSGGDIDIGTSTVGASTKTLRALPMYHRRGLAGAVGCLGSYKFGVMTTARGNSCSCAGTGCGSPMYVVVKTRSANIPCRRLSLYSR